MIIYKTTNLITGQSYIGKDSKNLNSYLGSGTYLKRAIKKYGNHNFVKEILETCSTLQELAERERYWIAKYDACNSPNYYNIVPGGEGGDSITHHPDRTNILKKISIGTSKGQMGRKHSKETIEKIRKSNLGIKKGAHNDEWKKLISSKLKGIKKPPRSKEHSNKIANSLKGKIPSNKGHYTIITDAIIENMIIDNTNGKSWNKISLEYGYSRYIITNNLTKYKNKK